MIKKIAIDSDLNKYEILSFLHDATCGSLYGSTNSGSVFAICEVLENSKDFEMRSKTTTLAMLKSMYPSTLYKGKIVCIAMNKLTIVETIEDITTVQ